MTEQNKFFTIEKQISAELISDMLITAVESGISYWCKMRTVLIKIGKLRFVLMKKNLLF
jgi:hypothetical protein